MVLADLFSGCNNNGLVVSLRQATEFIWGFTLGCTMILFTYDDARTTSICSILRLSTVFYMLVGCS